MDFSQYTVYVKNRPQKIAFLLDPSNYPAEIINDIVQYNQWRWGGRYNQIILCTKTNIEEVWLELLKLFDPDVIKSFVPITNKLLKLISHETNPYTIEITPVTRTQNRPIFLSDEGLYILPTQDNVEAIGRSFLRDSELHLFRFPENVDELIKDFIQRNFGFIQSNLTPSSSGLLNTKVVEATVNDYEGLASSLDDLTGNKYYVYPIQLCSLPSVIDDPSYNQEQETPQIILGSDLKDLAYFWNRSYTLQSWQRSKLSQLWIPEDFVDNDVILEPLKKFIKRFAEINGNQYPYKLKFMSSSIELARLTEIAHKLTEGSYLSTSAGEIASPIIPDVHTEFIFTEGVESHTLSGESSNIKILKPIPDQGPRGDAKWMSDIFIKYSPSYPVRVVNKEYWYQLPKNNSLSYGITSRMSRINRAHSISALIDQRENQIYLKLRDEKAIIRTQLLLRNTPPYTTDSRNKIVAPPAFKDVRRSNVGRYMSGYIDKFGGLSYAHAMLESRYWRRIFNNMSAKDLDKDASMKSNITNKIQAWTRPDTSITPQLISRIADNVIDLAKDIKNEGKIQPLEYFLKEKQKEVDDYNSANPEANFTLDEDDLVQDLRGLVQDGVFLQGLQNKCPNCGLASWVEVDDVKYNLVCEGCGYENVISPKQRWFFKLNSIVQSGSNNYLMPVILTLGQLEEEARSSFYFLMPQDVFLGRSNRPITDLDIVCIQDGKFIIGEVKNSDSMFKQSDFNTMKRVALRLYPDTIVFSSLDERPSRSTQAKIKALQSELNSRGLNTNVKWLQIDPQIFTPEPH